MLPAGYRRADHHSFLAGETAEGRGPGAEQHHEEGGVLLVREAPQLRRQILVQHQLEPPAAEALERRPRKSVGSSR